MKYNTYDAILQNDSDDYDAIAYARGMVWSECETSINTIAHAKHIETVNDIDVYYDYGADYYFFCPADYKNSPTVIGNTIIDF